MDTNSQIDFPANIAPPLSSEGTLNDEEQLKSAVLEELKTAEGTVGDNHQKNPGHDHCKLINISPPTQNHHMRNLSQGVKNGRNTSPLQGF